MEKDSGEIFRELKKDLSAYVELKLELLKLNTYERTGKVIAVLSYGVILLFLAFFAILFIFLALGFFLGDLFGSAGSGFGVVAVLYLLLIGRGRAFPRAAFDKAAEDGGRGRPRTVSVRCGGRGRSGGTGGFLCDGPGICRGGAAGKSFRQESAARSGGSKSPGARVRALRGRAAGI